MASAKNDRLNKSTVTGSVNLYDNSRSECTAEEKKQASMIGGHSWNILNNNSDREVYLRHARNSDHYVDRDGKSTSLWWARRQRVSRPGLDNVHVMDSRMTEASLTCPATAGKEDGRRTDRQLRQLCQAEAPMDYAKFSARKSELTPRTPLREPHNRTVPFQWSQRDAAQRPQAKTSDKPQWSARRGEPRPPRLPPTDLDMVQKADQLRAESHDVMSSVFASEAVSARSSGNVSARLHPGPEKAHFSRQRMDGLPAREITSWTTHNDKLTRGDPYHTKPLQRSGNSCVKYDIISNEKREFWY